MMVSKILFVGAIVRSSFKWLPLRASLYIWNLSRVFTILPLLVICNVSITSFHKCNGMFVVNEMLCKLRFSISMFEITEKFFESYMKGSPSPIYFLLNYDILTDKRHVC